MKPKVTRRQLAAALAAPALLAQTPAPAAADPASKAVAEQLRRNSEQLAKITVPQEVEPAVHFKV